MPLPLVAIVGRPNVGKSSLLNALAGRRISIVDPQPGVTRDRVSAVCEHDDVYFELVDTGGYGVEDADNLTEQIEAQIDRALRDADLVLFVVDVRESITALDRAVADRLRVHADRVLTIANKADAPHHDAQAGEFIRLGYGEPLCVSALHQRNTRDLLERIAARVRRPLAESPVEPVMKVVIVGRPNVGKSTFINSLAGQERMIVSEIPGTTRDAVDVRFEHDGRVFLAIDTAGVRRSARRDRTGLGFYSQVRAAESIRRADVVLLLIDATEKITTADKKLAEYVHEQAKPCVLVVNKWDLARGRAGAEDYGDYLARALPRVDYAPLAFTTATEARNLKSTIDLAQSLFKQARTRVTTGQLNRAIQQVVAARQPPAGRRGGVPRIFFATQVAVQPPTIVLFVNDPDLFREDYRRFLTKTFRNALPFAEIPIRLMWRSRQGEDRPGTGRQRSRSTSAE